jgi:hypothetical protein
MIERKHYVIYLKVGFSTKISRGLASGTILRFLNDYLKDAPWAEGHTLELVTAQTELYQKRSAVLNRIEKRIQELAKSCNEQASMGPGRGLEYLQGRADGVTEVLRIISKLSEEADHE